MGRESFPDSEGYLIPLQKSRGGRRNLPREIHTSTLLGNVIKEECEELLNINPNDFRKIVILTGAGISAESGISTFRDSGGLWEKHRIEDVATPQAFENNPTLVWQFYSLRRLQASSASPNLGHKCLVEYASRAGKSMTLITQNVDVLHQRADLNGTLPPLCMHGSLHQTRCSECERVYFDDFAYFDAESKFNPVETKLCSEEQRQSTHYLHHKKIAYRGELPLSPCCHQFLRPHIVWFGEVPMHMNEIALALEECDLFLSIGTSGQVYPAAGFLQMAKLNGATTVVINRDPLPTRAYIDQFLEGKAGEILPPFFQQK